ncbi:hypothetical protein SAMN05660359_02120 [Geodermatophilus obscurus]|uniref:Uncharacterized protein n=1 Tax=Geodermatophilus obscurus TaxID=1861 RepID=A0A1I5FDF6_9ACTN|nr:hypothetical protein SAMN05660359_02120 [Geodermatophilus obscurus]
MVGHSRRASPARLWMAVGMLLPALEAPGTDALAVLRGYAHAAGRTADDVADDLVEQCGEVPRYTREWQRRTSTAMSSSVRPSTIRVSIWSQSSSSGRCTSSARTPVSRVRPSSMPLRPCSTTPSV